MQYKGDIKMVNILKRMRCGGAMASSNNSFCNYVDESNNTKKIDVKRIRRKPKKKEVWHWKI